MGIFKRKTDKPRPAVGPKEPIPGEDQENAASSN